MHELLVYEFLILAISLTVYYLIYKSKSKISHKFNIYDIPNEDRKIHKEKTSSLGGILFFTTLIIFFCISIFFDQIEFNKTLLNSIIFIVIFFLIGFIDDSRGLKAYPKLIFMFLITYLILYFETNFTIKKLYFETIEINLSTSYLGIFFTTLCILLLVNALNLADGINGLATMIIITWIVYFQIFIFENYSLVGISLLIIMLLTFYNIYKGKFFLGNSGVMLLSIVTSLLFIYNYNYQIEYNKIFVEEIFILFMVPGIDMFRLFVQRIINKKDPFGADNNHLHHYLIKKYTLRTTLIIYFSLICIPLIILKTNILNSLTIIVLYLLYYLSLVYKNIKSQK